VGERVKLHSGRIHEVITVRSARMVLSQLDEMSAMRLGADKKATYGPLWLDVYYQADIMENGALKTIEPNAVKEVLPPS
jgi:hypothetical protein